MEASEKKHPCPDCHQCQWCSNERCRLCLRSPGKCRKKLSMAEQIALFERINCADSPAHEDLFKKTCIDKQQD